MSSLYLLAYRISGWLVNLGFAVLAFYTLRTRAMWAGRFVFLGLFLCIVAVLEVSITALSLLEINTYYLNFAYIIIEFSLLSLYLGWQQGSRAAKLLAVVLVTLFILFQSYQAFGAEAYKGYDALGIYLNTGVLILFALANLTVLTRSGSPALRLRQMADFWFSMVIFSLNLLDLIVFILTSVTYDSQSETAFFLLQIFRNTAKAVLMSGYLQGILLLRRRRL